MRKPIFALIVVLAVSAGLLGLYSCLRPQKILNYHPGAIGQQTQVAQLAFQTPGGPLSFYLEYTPPRTSMITFAMADDPEASKVRRDSPISFRMSALQGLSIHQDGEWLDVEGSIETVDPEAGLHRLVIDFPHYDSQLIAEAIWDFDQPFLDLVRKGVWLKPRADGTAEVPFEAVRHDNQRYYLFDPVPNSLAAAGFEGRWSVTFESSDDPAIGVFKIGKHTGNATGTFLTTTGDYRYLAGRVDGDLLRLSTFDGAHAFLFHARMQADGTIAGDFWSGNWHHETWTAVRDPDAQLPDMFGQTKVADADALDGLVFKDLDGNPARVADLLDATGAPARVIEIFGSWCPNCADAGAELARLKSKYGQRLGVVGLAFELTEDHERSAEQVRRYLERHHADWPVLVAGLSDKAKASAELPILDKVRSYPTTIFLNSDNEIISVHTGFTGPATGEAFSEQQREYERIIEELISKQP